VKPVQVGEQSDLIPLFVAVGSNNRKTKRATILVAKQPFINTTLVKMMLAGEFANLLPVIVGTKADAAVQITS